MARKQPQATRAFWYNVPWRFIFKVIILFFLLVGLAWLWQLFDDPARFPIQNVKVNGFYRHVTQQELKATLLPLVSGNFFTLSVDRIQTQLLKNPWISDATVRKIWPNTLSIRVNEQNPIARWNESGLLNPQGILFFPLPPLPSNLPELSGPKGDEKIVLQSYTEINQLLASLHLSVVELDLSSRMSWHIVLNNGMSVVIGSIDPLARLKRFIKVYPMIFKNQSVEDTVVDLRYTNGVAIAPSGT